MTAAARTGLFPVGPTAPRSYAPGSEERASTAAALEAVRSAAYDVPNLIGGQEVRTGRTAAIVTPHEHSAVLGAVHHGGAKEALAAVEAATGASRWWGRLPWEERAAPFLRAADMLQHGPWRDRLNAATMLELSKTTYQADIDAACETVDFIRFNVKNMLDMYDVQPGSNPGMWNQAEYRPLEGFVFAVTPFNFTCMNNLAFGPAVLGNTVVWKPAESASLVAHLSMQLLREAGLPDGVINVVYGDGAEIGTTVLEHRDLAAVHFTGSTATFQHIWRTVGANVASYRNYPRVVGETGGKDFILAHASADLEALAVACVRGVVRVPGAEVLGLVAPLRAAQPLAGPARAPRRHHGVARRRRSDADRDLRRRGDQRQAAREARGGPDPGAGRRPRRGRRHHRRQRRVVRRPHGARGVRPALAVHHR